MQCINGAARQGGVFGEEEGEDFRVVVAAVGKQCDDSRDELIGGVFVGEKIRRDAFASVVAHANEFVLPDHVEDAGYRNPELFGVVGNAE